VKTSTRKRASLTLPAAAGALLCLLLSLSQAKSGTLADKVVACADHLGRLPVAQGQVLSDSLEVLSWNIQKTSNEGWMEDLLELAEGTDLTFIQEAALQAQLGEVHPAGPLYQSFAQGYSSGSQSTGVMTLSTRAPTMQCNFTRTEPWLRTPKAAAVTEHALAGRDDRLLAINIHAVNFTLGVEDLREQLHALAILLDDHQGPVILAGDFNTWSKTRQQLVDSMLSRYGLTPVSFSPDLRTTAFGRVLDHIFVRGFQAEAARVVPVASSDHNALRARLRLVM